MAVAAKSFELSEQVKGEACFSTGTGAAEASAGSGLSLPNVAALVSRSALSYSSTTTTVFTKNVDTGTD